MILQSSIFTDFYKKSVDLNKQILHAWVEHSLFAWRWWLGILLIVISLTLWIKYRNRESADRLQYAGLFVALASSNLDYIGTFFGLWKYDYEIFPVISHYIPFSFFVLPITVMFLLQIRPRTNPLLKALAYSIFSVIALPIVHWIGIYDPVKWHYFYSFIIQFFIYLIAHYISGTDKFKKLYST
ncbi:CBO0543 family protein [Priestia megaterium]|uniref:CBO0543 family protein n=1 Tax=Priestia megaterium TaxID=1404 RepID=UPI00372D3B3D